MKHDRNARNASTSLGRYRGMAGALLIAGLLVACGSLGNIPQAQHDATGSSAVAPGADAVATLVAYHDALDRLDRATLRDARRGLPDPADDPLAQMRSAILLGHPRAPADPAQALALLDAVIASEHPDAHALRPLARLLSSQLRTRLQLDRQLERLDAQRRSAENARAELQKKLDALAEIERNLPARPSGAVAPDDASEETETR